MSAYRIPVSAYSNNNRPNIIGLSLERTLNFAYRHLQRWTAALHKQNKANNTI